MCLIFVCQQPIRKYFNNENFPIYGIRALQLKAVLRTYGIVCMCCVVCRVVGVLMVGVLWCVQGAGGSSDWWGSVPPPEG